RAPPLAMFCNGCGNPSDRLLEGGMLKLKRNAIAEAEIAGTDKQQIVAWHGGDLIDCVHGFLVFNLQSEEHLPVCVLQVLARIGEPEVRVGADAIEAALAGWRKTHPFHPLTGFRRAAAVRNHDAV